MTSKATGAKSVKSTPPKTDKTHDKAETTPTTAAQRHKGTDPQAKANSAITAPNKRRQQDRFSLRVDSKRSKAAEMFARDGGCAMKQVTETVGGPQYNLLRFLERQGHKVVRKDGIITVIPKASI